MYIQKILTDLIATKAVFTDIYLRVGEPFMVRNPSGWAKHAPEPLTGEQIANFLDVMAGKGWEQRVAQSPTQSVDIAKNYWRHCSLAVQYCLQRWRRK